MEKLFSAVFSLVCSSGDNFVLLKTGGVGCIGLIYYVTVDTVAAVTSSATHLEVGIGSNNTDSTGNEDWLATTGSSRAGGGGATTFHIGDSTTSFGARLRGGGYWTGYVGPSESLNLYAVIRCNASITTGTARVTFWGCRIGFPTF